MGFLFREKTGLMGLGFIVLVCIPILLSMSINLHEIGLPRLIFMVPLQVMYDATGVRLHAEVRSYIAISVLCYLHFSNK